MKNQTSWHWVILRSTESDAISSLPALTSLLKNPDRSVVVWTEKNLKPIYKTALDRGLAGARERVRIMAFDFAWPRARAFEALVRQAARQFPPENAYCFDRSFLSALIAVRSQAATRVGFSSTLSSFLYSKIVPYSVDRGVLTAEKFVELVKAAEVGIDSWEPKKHVSILASKTPPVKSVVAISLRKKSAAAAWPLENWLTTLRQLILEGESLVLIGSASESESAEKIVSQLKSPLIKNLVAQASFEEEITVLESAKGLLSHDSRDTLLASELGVPTIALFGPTLPEFGEAPWRRNSKVLGVANLSCRPCHLQPPEVCPKTHHKCLKDIEPKRVVSELKNVFGTSGSNS